MKPGMQSLLQTLPLHQAASAITLDLLPNDKILDWTKLKAFADDKMNVN